MTEKRDIIRGKVAKVLNTREIAINVGSLDGVEMGMRFDILDPKLENISDPDTGEVLGSIPRAKVRVKVFLVHEKLSLARTFRKDRINIGGTGPNLATFAQALMPEKWIDKYETFKTDEATWEDLDESQSYVKIGDPIIEVIDREED